jgi:tRNA(Ile)-lysidine synthase
VAGTRRPPAVARVLTRVTTTVREHDLMRPGDLVLVAVSGGPDSVCLLYSLWFLRRLLKIRLAAFHFDHRLRADSAKDAAYVRALCARLSTPLYERAAGDPPPRGHSVEAWASSERGNAGNDVRRTIGAQVVAEGHTLDDQAETVLLNLLRGTGLEGLAGIRPGGREDRTAQPLLDVTRAEVEGFCRALHLRPRRDPMNDDPRYLRAAIRHDVLPSIERATGRGVSAAIVRTAETLQGDVDELYEATVQSWREVVEERADGSIVFDAAKLGALPRSLASRVIRLAVYNVLATDWAAPWSKEAMEAVFDLARGRLGRRRDLPDGRVAVRDRTHVIVSRPPRELPG